MEWVWIPVVVLLLIPAMQVGVVRFVDPPRTVPMLIEQAPLRYRWIPLAQMPEMFLKHLWISEDQRFFQHEGFDWKEMGAAMEKAERTGKPVRGASTITNQCARSIFLWQGQFSRPTNSATKLRSLMVSSLGRVFGNLDRHATDPRLDRAEAGLA